MSTTATTATTNSMAATDPWADFFKVYIELATELRREFPPNNNVDRFIDELKQGNPQDERHKAIVHDVVAKFRGKSQSIILQDASYFDEPLFLFSGIDGLDIAKLWHEHPLYRNGIWAWIEQIYIIGNVCLHPNRKDKFLQAVRQLKATRRQNEDNDGNGDGEEPEEDISSVIDGIAQMMGMGDNPAMKEMMGEVAQHMQRTMQSVSNPMELVQQMLNGDTSSLGDLEQRMQAKMAQKIQSGELTEEELERQRNAMMQQFGGLQGINQMANNLGLDVSAMGVPTGQTAPTAPTGNSTKEPNQPEKKKTRKSKSKK